MSTIYQGPKTSEKEFISEVQRFLSANGYIQKDECHFGGDNNELADVELVLVSPRWPEEMPGALLLEAKSHHSKDSPNTINKAFGQLLKETNKSLVTRAQRKHCLGLLIPIDGAIWTDPKGESISRGSGIDYYRTGFQRIDADAFAGFGHLVKARYILAFSVHEQYLDVFKWDAFHAGNQPLARLTAQ